jgi:hypothetical protein
MYARTAESVEARLGELRHDEVQETVLGGVALAASLLTTAVYPPLAVPLFVGGLAMGTLGVWAIWRHWDLVDRLADDRDAYSIPEVRAYAARDAGMERRIHYAALLRSWTRPPADPRIEDVGDELEELARALEDVDLELDPGSALACRRFLTDATVSPLLDATRPSGDLRPRIVQIRTGFQHRQRSSTVSLPD